MKMLDTAEERKRFYKLASPQYDPDGFQLYFAAQKVTGIRRLWEAFPYDGMDKDTFWALIREAKTACGQDIDAMAEHLQNCLVSMGPAAAKSFHKRERR